MKKIGERRGFQIGMKKVVMKTEDKLRETADGLTVRRLQLIIRIV